MNNLSKIANSFNLKQSLLITQFPIRYADNLNDPNSIIDLMFFRSHSKKFNTHLILPDLRSPSNHTSLIVNITIQKEFLQEKQLSIYKSNNEEKKFIKHLRKAIENINTSNICDIQILKITIKTFASSSEIIWREHKKQVQITKKSKEQQNSKCISKIELYQNSRFILNWKDFRKMVKKTK